MIELACIADSGYMRHAAAMLRSVVTSSPGQRWQVNVLHSAPVDLDDRARLEETLAGTDAHVTLHHVDPARLDGLPGGYFPQSVWLRILLPELLGASERVLYIDADVIAVDDVRPLWETDLADCLLGAVTNPLYPFQPPHAEQLGIHDPAAYFNSGVLLMHLERMRSEGTTDALREYAVRHPESVYPDQDALNIVVGDRRLPLHPRWNVQNTLLDLPTERLPFSRHLVEEALSEPALVHFIGPFKPWRYLCMHPWQHLYLDAAARTPWGPPLFPDRSVRNAVLRRLPLAALDRVERSTRAVSRRSRHLARYFAEHPISS